MKIYFLIVTLYFTSLTPLLSYAEINMKDASYRNSFSDIKYIERTYNSRSIYTGFFGFGWCSNFEKSLEIIETSKQIILKDCDKESYFVLMDENSLLKRRIFINPITKEKIFFQSGSYSYYLKNNDIHVFNRTGQLTKINKNNRNSLIFSYKDDLLRKIKINNYNLTINYNENNRITEIRYLNKTATYKYEEKNLILSQDSNKKSHHYSYDSLNNMINVVYPDNTQEHIFYNNDYDRVVKIELRNNCTEYYNFQTKVNGSLHQTSTLIKKCDNKKVHQYTYEFWYEERSNGLKSLKRYKIHQLLLAQKNKTTLEITYHPIIGTPIRIIKNGKDLINKI